MAELLAANGISAPILHLGPADTYLEHASREELLVGSRLDAAVTESSIRPGLIELIPVAAIRSTG